MKKRKWISALLIGSMTLSFWNDTGTLSEANAATANNTANMVVEYLDRGICAVNTGSGMLVSWRFLASDPDNLEEKDREEFARMKVIKVQKRKKSEA